MGSLMLRLQRNKLFKDSFWAVFGNGIGYGILLLAGILIARFLGKDLYGEYGLVKTTMFTIAAFSTFGLSYTSTRFVADYVNNYPEKVYALIRVNLTITLISSSLLALLIVLFAGALSIYLEEPSLKYTLRFLAFVTITRAISTTQNGILAGFKQFKNIAKNNIISGLSMLLLSVPLTLYFSLTGALCALAFSQIMNVILNRITLKKKLCDFNRVNDSKLYVTVLKFSLPVALQELSYSVCGWLLPLILVKYSSMGELGIYTAASQWNAIILFLPGLLYNVVLSHLSSTNRDSNTHNKILRRMLLVNVFSTLIPFVFVYIFSDFISTFYGSTFRNLPQVMEILVFTTVFAACSKVFQSELIATSRMWLLFTIRILRDVFNIFLVYILLNSYATQEDGARYVAISVLISSILYFFVHVIVNRYLKNKEGCLC